MKMLEDHAYVCLAEEGVWSVFVDRRGQFFLDHNGCDTKRFGRYWEQMIKPAGARFPPQLLRHIFVAERRGEDAVEGPNDQGAAMVMGNSIRQWDRVYDKNFQRTSAQRAVDAMAVWRAHSRARPSAPPLQLPALGREVAELDEEAETSESGSLPLPSEGEEEGADSEVVVLSSGSSGDMDSPEDRLVFDFSVLL